MLAGNGLNITLVSSISAAQTHHRETAVSMQTSAMEILRLLCNVRGVELAWDALTPPSRLRYHKPSLHASLSHAAGGEDRSACTQSPAVLQSTRDMRLCDAFVGEKKVPFLLRALGHCPTLPYQCPSEGILMDTTLGQIGHSRTPVSKTINKYKYQAIQ